MIEEIRIGWWSAGITSAVACKMALDMYPNVKLLYVETGKAHPDNARFKSDCEQWYGAKIETVQNSKGYKNPLDVVYKERYINGPDGAKCTQVLKKQVRDDVEERYRLSLFNNTIIANQVFGFEFERKQVNRAIRFLQQYPSAKALFPLIEKGITKNNSAAILMNAGIELPAMYKLGFSNNNCIGCFKGGKGYWNKTRDVFPEDFKLTAIAERHIGHSCIKGVFLDELEIGSGYEPEVVIPECGIFCEVDFADLEDKSLEGVMIGQTSVYEAAKRAA